METLEDKAFVEWFTNRYPLYKLLAPEIWRRKDVLIVVEDAFKAGLEWADNQKRI